MDNLDLLTAAAAQRIIELTAESESAEVDNLATKALGVLQGNGVYAAVLFLYSRTSKADRAIAPAIRQGLVAFSAQVLCVPAPADNAADALRFAAGPLADGLETLFLIKRLWEQTLIYVRYGAKAREG